MKLGLTVSSCAHAAILGWAMISFSSTEPFEVQPEVALPVDLVSVEEFTELTTGLATGEQTETPAAPEAPVESNTEVLPDPEPVEEPEPAPAPQPAEAPPPEPEPEPVPEQAAVEPEPAPAPEPEPQEPPPPARVELPDRVAMPKRPPRPREQQIARADDAPQPTPITPQAEQDRQFNPDDISALLDKQEREQASGGVTQGAVDAPPSLGAPSGFANRLSMSEIDYLRQQISRCWNPPIGVLDAQGLVVKLDLELAPDGALIRAPIVANSSGDPIFTIASEAAARAVVQCQPYTLPPEKYDLWRRLIVNFDPREMLGG